MRKSKLKKPVAVVRNICGMSTRQFADMVGLGLSTIEKLETGRLRMSEDNAFQISRETGADFRWLLEGDASDEAEADKSGCMSSRRLPFTKEHFEFVRSHLDKRQPAPLSRSHWPKWIYLNAILANAALNGKADLADYRVKRFIDDLEKEFGSSDEQYRIEAARWRATQDFAKMFSNPESSAQVTNSYPGAQLKQHREAFVPAFVKAWNRLKEANAADKSSVSAKLESALFPLFRWAADTLRVFAPPHYDRHPELENIASPVVGNPDSPEFKNSNEELMNEYVFGMKKRLSSLSDDPFAVFDKEAKPRLG